jgi:hypothetical protein
MSRVPRTAGPAGAGASRPFRLQGEWFTSHEITFYLSLVTFIKDRQRLQHTHQNLHTTDRAKKPIINT